jgi:hypothetical protein
VYNTGEKVQIVGEDRRKNSKKREKAGGGGKAERTHRCK